MYEFTVPLFPIDENFSENELVVIFPLLVTLVDVKFVSVNAPDVMADVGMPVILEPVNVGAVDGLTNVELKAPSGIPVKFVPVRIGAVDGLTKVDTRKLSLILPFVSVFCFPDKVELIEFICACPELVKSKYNALLRLSCLLDKAVDKPLTLLIWT